MCASDDCRKTSDFCFVVLFCEVSLMLCWLDVVVCMCMFSAPMRPRGLLAGLLAVLLFMCVLGCGAVMASFAVPVIAGLSS